MYYCRHSLSQSPVTTLPHGCIHKAVLELRCGKCRREVTASVPVEYTEHSCPGHADVDEIVAEHRRCMLQATRTEGSGGSGRWCNIRGGGAE